jgi:hypothetical protein
VEASTSHTVVAINSHTVEATTSQTVEATTSHTVVATTSLTSGCSLFIQSLHIISTVIHIVSVGKHALFDVR